MPHTGLAGLARKYNTHIQSHISECCGEVNCVREMHPEFASDTAVFEEMGLLTGRTVMAHGTLLSDDDIRQLAVRGTAVSHCPLSNFFLGDACFRWAGGAHYWPLCVAAAQSGWLAGTWSDVCCAVPLRSWAWLWGTGR